MKITAVSPVLLSAPYGTAADTELRRFYPTGLRSAAFVVIDTDEGVSGLGETYAGVFVPEVVVTLVREMGRHLVGLDPRPVRALHAMLARAIAYWGHGGVARNVLSAIEIALWDLRGKALGVPVYELLGGARTDAIELYASGGIDKAPDDLAAELQAFVADGFRTVKIRDRGMRGDAVGIARDALGPGVRLIVDANQSFCPRPATRAEALGYARRIAAHDVLFLEEPLGVDDLPGYRRLTARAPLPISGGETLNSAAAFRRHIEVRAFDIVQPDATVIGGIGDCVDALCEAGAAGLEGVCHAFGAAPCQAANAHAAFAAGCRLLEWAMPVNPLREALLVEPWRVVNGSLQRPTAPGLGIGLTEEVRERYRYVPGTANPGNFR